MTDKWPGCYWSHLALAHVLEREFCLQDEELFRSEGSTQLDGIMIDRMAGSSEEQSQRPHSEPEQFTVNAPHLLDRPVPAKPNPMARFIESSAQLSHCHIAKHMIWCGV